jgi:glycosyltransferase involved in cell wall biosynthesis
MAENISVCITAGNEESNIRRCLESVTWADEIIVVDSFSKDNTVSICKEYTDLVFQHRWLGYIGQKNLIKDLAQGPWILFIDADEEISPKLKDEILIELNKDTAKDIAGYEFPRMVKYLGKWIRHGDWYPDIKMRLFRKALGKCGGKEPHDRTTVDGPVKRLKGDLFHYTYKDVADQLSSLDRFSTISAEGMFNEGRKPKIADLFFRPPFRLIRGYVIKGGFLDGLQGVVISIITSYGVFLKYVKLWELHLKKRQNRS